MGDWIKWDYETIRSLLYHMIDILEYYKLMSNTPNCNDCGNLNDCGIAPDYGQQVRYNCHLWEPRETAEYER